MIGVIIFFLRVFLAESIEFEQARLEERRNCENSVQQLPLKQAFLHDKSVLFITISLAALPAAMMYFLDAYYPQYVSDYFSIPLATAWGVDAGILCLMMIGMVLFGALSDRIGKKKIIAISACYFLCLSFPLLTMLSAGQDSTVIWVLLLFTLGLAMYDGPLPALLVKLAPLKVRYTVFALGFNISFALFGGSAPLICSLLAHLSPLAPAVYFMVLACFSLSILYCLGKKSNFVKIQGQVEAVKN